MNKMYGHADHCHRFRAGRVSRVREPLDFTPEERAEDAASTALYGPWESFDVDGARAFFDGFDRPWWLVGGWAIEAFTGAEREHEDIDVSMLACDVPALREFVGDRWHLWTNVGGTLRPTDRALARPAGARLPDLGPPRLRLAVGDGHADLARRRRAVAEQAHARARRAARRGHLGGRRRDPGRATPRSCCSTRPFRTAARTDATSTALCRSSTIGNARGSASRSRRSTPATPGST